MAELRALDYRLRLRGPGEATPDVAIVAVDDRSIAVEGRWPWPRRLQAELIDRIAAAGAAVIGIDIVQSETEAQCRLPADATARLSAVCSEQLREFTAGDGDRRLAEAITAAPGTVLGYFFDFSRDRSGEAPHAQRESTYKVVRHHAGRAAAARLRLAPAVTRNLPEFDAAAHSLGYFNFFPDADGLYRRVPLAIRLGEQIATPLSLAMLAARWPDRIPAIAFDAQGVESVRFGTTRIPVTADGQMLINFRGARRTFPHVAATDLLRGEIPAGVLRDRLVLLGVTAVAVGDVRAVPLDPSFPGVEIHANVLDNILRADFIAQASRRDLSELALAELGSIFGLSLLLAVVLIAARGWRGAIAAAFALAAFLAFSQWLFTTEGVALRVVYPALALALTYTAIGAQHYVLQERATLATRRMLGLYLSPALAHQLSEHPEMLELGGEKSDRTVLFSDVREFTAFSEKLPPEELVELLNLYLGAMTDIVFQQEGMLDKYIGDGIMAVWGAPIAQADHAARACRAALAMLDQLAETNRIGAARAWPRIDIRIGINSGPMVFGNMGSSSHFSLTVMGDNVNLGARLEGINKLYGTRIIASEATFMAAQREVVARELDLVRVKGKQQVVRIYEILAAASAAAEWNEILRQFDAGLTAYRAKRWSDAEGIFEQLLRLRPDDGPADLYLRRSRKLRREPPEADWVPVTIFGE